MAATFRLQRHLATFRRRLRSLDIPVTDAGRWGLGSVDLHFDQSTHPGVAFITLNQPSKRNAVTAAMMLDLAGHVTELHERCRDDSGSDAVRAVVLRGAGSHFCAGADFSLARALRTAEQGVEMFDLMTSTLDGLYDLPCITVAAVEGHAKGGGAEMLTACDFRVFADDADVQYVHSRMGISPGWGGASRLRDIVGRGRALQLLAMGKPLTGGKAALEYGLADFVVEEGGGGGDMGVVGSAGTQNRRGDSAGDEGDGRYSSNQYSSVDLGALAFLAPVLKVESVAALRAIKRAVSGGRMGDGAPGGGGRNDDERQAFCSVWGAEDNLRAVDAAVARLTAGR